MSLSVKRRSQRGFTLVELLIVVAIIGVLSTIGVPTFRRMVQKAKKSEAKVNLGGIYTAESAFFSEYGIYGNLLEQVGFEADGVATAIYIVGFMDGAGAKRGRLPATAADSNLAGQLNGSFPTYFTTPVDETRAGNLRVTGTGNTNGPCDVAAAAAEFNTYRACAVGTIAPGALSSESTTMDVWVIDNRRGLVNFQDGVGLVKK